MACRDCLRANEKKKKKIFQKIFGYLAGSREFEKRARALSLQKILGRRRAEKREGLVSSLPLVLMTWRSMFLL